jgi:glutamate dehydrogenase
MEGVIRDRLTDTEKERLNQRIAFFVDGGFSRRLAARAAILEQLHPALDVVETAARRRTGVDRVAGVSFGLVEALELQWLRRQIEVLEVSGQWHAMSRANLRDELATHHNEMVERVLAECGRKKDPAAAWLQAHGKRAEEVSTMLSSMKKQAEMDYATLSVAVRALGQLADDPTNEQ